METNVFPFGFLEGNTFLVPSGFPAVVPVDRTLLLPHFPVSCEGEALADSNIISAI